VGSEQAVQTVVLRRPTFYLQPVPEDPGYLTDNSLQGGGEPTQSSIKRGTIRPFLWGAIKAG